MSLSIAGSIIAASLRTTEVASAVAASNIANASTEGYTRKTAALQATDSGVGYATIDVGGISSTVDRLLLKTVVGAQADLGYSETLSGYLDQYQSALGTTDSETSVAALVDAAESAFATVATTPESESAKAAAVSALEEATAALREQSSQIQDLRAQADDAIATEVGTINTALETIDDLNTRIVSGKALGQDTADLEDQRNQALMELSKSIGITYQEDGNGMVRVSTQSGIALVDSTVHTLSYESAASVSSDTVYSATGTSGFQGIMVSGRDVTSSLNSGTLGALIDLRDTVLPEQQANLDALATSLKETLNATANTGTAVPPPNSLTGTQSVSGSDALSGSGTLRIALTNADGTAAEVLDLDLSSYATVQDVIDAIDAMAGVSASLSTDGKLTIAADDADQGVALAGDGDAVGTAGEGFSAAFGFNDLLVGDGAEDLMVNPVLSADTARLPTAALSMASGLAAGDTAVASGDATVAAALGRAFADPVSFGAAGSLSARTATFADYAGAIVQNAATAAERASTDYESQQTYVEGLETTLASQSGVNVNEETAAVAALQSAYEAAAAVMGVLQEMFDTAIGMVD